MQLLRIVLVLAALLAVVGQYLQEMHRLVTIKKLPGLQARDYYEATRQRGEKLLLVGTVALALLAVGTAIYVFGFSR